MRFEPASVGLADLLRVFFDPPRAIGKALTSARNIAPESTDLEIPSGK